MADIIGPFDPDLDGSGNPIPGTGEWSQDEWYRHANRWAPSGVNGTPASSSSTGDLPLTLSGLTWNIGLGRAWVHGAGFERTSVPSASTIPTNTNVSQDRRDRVVLRRDIAAKTLAPTLITGTPSATPAAPVVHRNESSDFDLPLFSFLTPRNSGTGTGSIIDERVYFDAVRGCLASWDANGRNALSSVATLAAGTLIYEQSTQRTFRWNAISTRWDYVSGPWYTWTPTLTAGAAGPAVTYGGSGAARGTYIISEGRFRFTAEILVKDPINGQSGQLFLSLPTGVVSKTTDPSQDMISCHLAVPGNGTRWAGVAQASLSATTLAVFFPATSGTSTLSPFQNASAPGATGTGVPLISGSYPLTDGSRFSAWGEFELSSWPAL